MASKDLVSKHLLKRLAVDLAFTSSGLEIEAREVLASEQQRVEDCRADLVMHWPRPSECATAGTGLGRCGTLLAPRAWGTLWT
jgi:hypothetical protein